MNSLRRPRISLLPAQKIPCPEAQGIYRNVLELLRELMP